MAATLLAVASVTTMGCPGGSGGTGASNPGCTLANVGDTTKPIELTLTALDVDGVSHPLTDGADIALLTPLQGGRVVYVGARATNLSPCGVVLTGSIKDTASGKVMIDKRTVNLKPTGDGDAASTDADESTFANVAACPNEWSSRDIDDQPYEITLEIEDKAGRTATASAMAVPRCAETEPQAHSECVCTCKEGYVLGAACP